MKGKILYVDDVFVIKKIVKKPIEDIGYQLLEAIDGQKGLSVLADEYKNVKLILTDWNMPVMNGLDFLKAVKSHESYKHIPVIMITNESEKTHIINAIQAGAASYILKPFSNVELIDKILHCLKTQEPINDTQTSDI